jgi:abhydrolase domain-containing protein 14
VARAPSVASFLALASAFSCGGSTRAVEPDVAVVQKILHREDASVAYREAGPSEAPGVLLLHGGKYSSKTWEELGTIAILARAGYHVVALDLPGYGDSSALAEAKPAESAPDQARIGFLASIVTTFFPSGPAVVAPSMSGTYAFPLLAKCPELVGAFVAIAPAGAEGFEKTKPLPVLILWGTDDAVFPVAGAAALAAKFPGAQTELFQGAAHACYLDRPEEFHAKLVAFLASALPTKPPR